jgi:hypothetical protein
MEDQKKTDAKLSAEAQAQADGHGAKLTTEELSELRDRRNLEYFQAALSVRDPLGASIGAINGDLMIFANHLQQIIMPAFQSLPKEPGALAMVVPAIDAYGRVARQVERFTNLKARLDRQQEAGSKAMAKMAAMKSEREAASG